MPLPFVHNLECPGCGRRQLAVLTKVRDRPARYQVETLPPGFTLIEDETEDWPLVRHECGATFRLSVGGVRD